MDTIRRSKARGFAELLGHNFAAEFEPELASLAEKPQPQSRSRVRASAGV